MKTVLTGFVLSVLAARILLEILEVMDPLALQRKALFTATTGFRYTNSRPKLPISAFKGLHLPLSANF